MTNATKGKLLHGTAIAIDVGVPLTATLTQFPVWVEQSSEATVSGLFLVMALLSCIPFIKQIKEFMKNPSAPILWSVLFVGLAALQNIIGEIVVVAFSGMVANLAGAGIYKLGDIVSK